ncbi:hypothetical protein Kpol_221p2 [Vanderwaltozyma polyspora DSM 70294]|uniref:Uncharacterized protein n=1 Tax=Vanderwaltozyma polyspora (strain ATCC 22028 / DSM 70294 / BCRC 21397 / CBS 2163 / NBRC 10782 / NRRL Y-8283 / UCD 57-17) TaxID=436907 RepID=A7TTI2_VANPO|nr:uncharacterized protein Kpol_221p2 [Vanderwaltozyma polyspora DSM 70294]EDO14424.1 hypothetical protein Kpol_221p2 [Vanderwaltozyma polyspora DSM 70294]
MDPTTLVTIISHVSSSGAGLLMSFVALSGSTTSGTLKDFYWFDANTSGIGGIAPNKTRWFNYRWCSISSAGDIISCTYSEAATPFSPVDNFLTTVGVPKSFIKNRNTYFYLSRTAWGLWLVGLIFNILSFAGTIHTNFYQTPRLFKSYSVLRWVALFLTLVSTVLYTACYAKAQDVFHSSNLSAAMGLNNFAFAWASVAILIIDTLNSIYSLRNYTSLFEKNKIIYPNNITGQYPMETYSQVGYGAPPPHLPPHPLVVPAPAQAPTVPAASPGVAIDNGEIDHVATLDNQYREQQPPVTSKSRFFTRIKRNKPIDP